jgi:hypothetical protein
MADTFSIGLPNQGLKQLVCQYQNSVLQTIPLEVNATDTAGAGETDIIVEQTVPANRKVTLTSLLVTAGDADDVFKLYRNGTVILSFIGVIAQSLQVFPYGVGREFDEGETWKVTVTSVAGGADSTVSASGRSELKRQMLYSPVVA